MALAFLKGMNAPLLRSCLALVPLSIALNSPTPFSFRNVERARSGLPLLDLRVGENHCTRGQDLRVEVAATPSEQAQGLSRRRSLPRNGGMLFLFDAARPASFWMKDTWIPLSLAYFGPKGELMSVYEMKVEEDPSKPGSSYRSDVPVIAALETGAGTLDPLPPGTVLCVEPWLGAYLASLREFSMPIHGENSLRFPRQGKQD